MKRRDQSALPDASLILDARALAQVGSITRALSDVADSVNPLLLLTPTNGEAAFKRFVSDNCEHTPCFEYRPIDIDVDELKRQLHLLRIEEVADPSLARLLREQREHIDYQLNMLAHRNDPRCLRASLNIYGGVENHLLNVARGITETLSPDVSERRQVATVGAQEFRDRALLEFEHYRRQDATFPGAVQVRDDITSLTVIKGTLLVPSNTELSESRADALVAHEVGTHLLTFHNGMAQPLELMSTGLAGYEQLQEGLAVVNEYLAGGFTSERLRLLAARVIAVHRLQNGAEFIDVFRELRKTIGLSMRRAFFVTMRVFRGGGWTKDAIYLRGVLEVLEHLRLRRPFELLFTGKFAASHVPLVRELLQRQVLKPPALLPRALKTRMGRRRLSVLEGEARTVFDLCQSEAA